MCPAAPVTATLIGVFMAQLAINILLSKAKANTSSVVERSSRHPVNLPLRRCARRTSLGMTR